MERVEAGIDNSQVYGHGGVGILAEPPKESETFARKGERFVFADADRRITALHAAQAAC